MNRAIFGLLAFLLLNGVARAGGGPAELNQYDVPAEARWAPFFANMPTCDDGGVLSTISGRFGQTQQEFWNSQLAISGFDRVREIGFRSNGLAYIPRRFCIARAAMSDSKERTVIYNVVSAFGITRSDLGRRMVRRRPRPELRLRARLQHPSPDHRARDRPVQMAQRIWPESAELD